FRPFLFLFTVSPTSESYTLSLHDALPIWPFAGVYDIGNHHLTVGARIAGRIADRVGNVGLPAGSIRLRFRGSAGQSFGAFALPGMRLELEGEANDYVAKGLSGGEIVIRPFREGVLAGVADQQALPAHPPLPPPPPPPTPPPRPP